MTSVSAATRKQIHKQISDSFQQLPDLIEIQKRSFEWFLKEGLPEALESFSPIQDYSGRLELHLLPNYELEQSQYNVPECRARDLTYASHLKIPVQLVNKQSGEIKEQKIFIGELPLMTDRGTFVINGAERVVVSQIVRSPGVYFKREDSDTSGKVLYSATVIPNRGAWLKFEVDTHSLIHIRVDKTRKILASTFLRALGYQTQDMLELFRHREFFQKTIDKEQTLGIETTEQALIEVYKKLRPGDPPSAEGGQQMIKSRFFDPKRYDLGRVGRYKMNNKLKLDIPEDTRTLDNQDIIAIIDYLIGFGYDLGEFDDIDHLGNRRIRSVGELLQNQFRVGLTRIERIVRERMTIQDIDNLTPQNLINAKPLVASIKEFFGSSQLSQFMDQTNPLSELTHKRRLSALGPGGLNRERAGYAVRDIHTSHYGRICPIETPEGPNAGLINSMSTFARVNEYGFLETPYWRVRNGVITDELVFITADKEDNHYVAPGDLGFKTIDGEKRFDLHKIPVRFKGDFFEVDPTEVEFVGVSPVQIVSVATSLIPFLEHDDANRALMGSNMQRQSVPLVRAEPPLVGTGLEKRSAFDSGTMVLAEEAGEVTYVSADKIRIKNAKGDIKQYDLLKFYRSNQDTTINQKPVVSVGDKVEARQLLADGASTVNGELALGRNVLVAFMPWEGYNFEDAILVSQRLVRDDVYTSIHIEKYETEARTTKLGAEEITRELPSVGEDAVRDLDEDGIIRVGAEIDPGDILVGKVTPKGESEHPPEEKLLRAIFGEKARDVRDTSLRVPHGEKGRVVDVRVFSRENGDELPPGVNKVVRVYVAQRRKISVGDKIAGRHGNKGIISRILPIEDMPYLPDGTPVDIVLNPLGVPGRMNVGQIYEYLMGLAAYFKGQSVEVVPFDEMFEEMASQKLVEKELTEARELQEQNMIADIKARAEANGDDFDEAAVTAQAKANWEWLNKDGKITLYDGRTGEPFLQKVGVGCMYVMKLVHLVDDKIHARSTGPYSLVTQQPLGGKAQFGGQRFGEMEVWGLEAYGAAYTLQEMLTIKSDDVMGRAAAYEAIVKGKNIQKPGIPESFKVLIRELQSLGLDMQILRVEEDGSETEVELFEETSLQQYKERLKDQLVKSTLLEPADAGQ
ncbi:MAG: DNA-directed RNA polymerase subunit beta [Candidatus Sericytochromatia bacterium]|nr:DNA-directed RNA polymerase subunit beta [Candidatus Sericytochromatia bacterium]